MLRCSSGPRTTVFYVTDSPTPQSQRSANPQIDPLGFACIFMISSVFFMYPVYRLSGVGHPQTNEQAGHSTTRVENVSKCSTKILVQPSDVIRSTYQPICKMMDLVGMTELADVGKLQFWRSACVDSLRRDEEVLGHVELICVKPIFLRGVWIKFTGFNILRSDDGRGDILEKVDLLVAEEDHYLGGLHEVFFGFGEEEQNESTAMDSGALLQLDAGTHKWNFAFKIPINAPFSYCDERVEVIYTLNRSKSTRLNSSHRR